MNYNHLYPFISLGGLFLTSILGVYGIKGKVRNPVKRVFAILCLSISLYLFVELKFLLSQNLKEILFWARLYYLTMFFVISNFLYFTLVFPKKNKILEDNKYGVFLIYLPFFIFIYFIFDNSLIAEVSYLRGEKILKFGEIFSLFVIFFLSFLLSSIFSLIKSYRESEAEIVKIQISYVLTGVLMGGIVGIFANFIYPLFKIKISPLSGFSLVLITIFTAYALVREKPLDIWIILRKSILYYILTLLTIAFYILGVIKLGAFFSNLLGFTSYLFQTALIVGFAFIFKPVADSLSNFIDSKLFPAIFNYRKILSEFSSSLLYYLEIPKLTKMIIDTVCETLNIEKGVIFLNREDLFLPVETRNLEMENLEFSKYEELFNFFLNNNKTWEFHRLKNFFRNNKKVLEILDEFQKKGIYLYLPMVSRGKLLAIFMLGEKKNEVGFSEEELDLLYTISNQAAIALENSIGYENLKEVYRKLSEAEKFTAIGEFSAEIAHQIRNPLNNIKGAAELLKNEKITFEEREKFLNYLIEEVRRLNQLLQQFLNYAKPKELQFQKVDINEFLTKILKSFEIEFSNFKIEVETKFQNPLPKISLDINEMEKVFTNIITNAIQSMADGGKFLVSTNFKNNFIEIVFSDTGSGIEQENIPKIFSPFFTTKEKGIGLGLSIAEKIVKLHKGEILVESKENSGTTFKIKLNPGLTC
jgi:signal transduction histidine kinase